MGARGCRAHGCAAGAGTIESGCRQVPRANFRRYLQRLPSRATGAQAHQRVVLTATLYHWSPGSGQHGGVPGCGRERSAGGAAAAPAGRWSGARNCDGSHLSRHDLARDQRPWQAARDASCNAGGWKWPPDAGNPRAGAISAGRDARRCGHAAPPVGGRRSKQATRGRRTRTWRRGRRAVPGCRGSTDTAAAARGIRGVAPRAPSPANGMWLAASAPSRRQTTRGAGCPSFLRF
jgi:hypothetical protein